MWDQQEKYLIYEAASTPSWLRIQLKGKLLIKVVQNM